MDANSPTSGQPDSPAGRYVILSSPDDMTAIERRVADVIHYGFYLKDNSPPGIYLVADPEGDQSHIVAGDGEHVRDGSGGSESVTAVETFSSATSESTVESSDSSIASQVKAMKISEPTFRVEEDPPEIIGSYANLTYTDEVIAGMGSNVREKGALYRLQITINLSGLDVAFELQVDTGASTTWLFHRNACLLHDMQDNWDATGDVACRLMLVAGTKRPRQRAALPPSYMPSYLAKHIPNGLPREEKYSVDSPFHYPRVAYGSGKSKLVVGPMRDPIDFKIQRARNWLTSGPDEDADLEARFSFGICDAATEPVFGDLRMDGLVGFGPESNMSAFSSQYSHELDYGPREYPSFSAALQSCLPRIAGKEGGIILYFCLNPPGVDEGYSFLAFNVFPAHLLHQKISWTPPIYVAPPLSSSRKWHWIIVVRKIVIRLIADEAYKARGGYEDKDLLIDFGNDGERFHVDTGSSTSMFPEHAMLAFRQVFDRSRPYAVPEWVDLRESKVEYTFASKSSELAFAAPARHFLCDKYRQGLIWESDSPPEQGEEPPVSRCILGLVRHGVLIYCTNAV